MQLNYSYKTTSEITKLLKKLEILKQVIDLFPQFPNIELNLKRQSFLKSSLFSAKIEGNQLQLDQLSRIDKQSQEKLEVFNILAAIKWLYSFQAPNQASIKLLLKLHRFVLKDITSNGKFRTKSSAIFNQAGVAIYLAPPTDEIKGLCQKLVNRINSSKDPGPINAAINHFIFEKIHPFMDGNGRVGRLLSTYILKQSGFGFRGLVNLEEYLEANRSLYYDFLNLPGKDLTRFIEFFLKGLTSQAEATIKLIKNIGSESPEDLLSPRRKEILAVVRDHKIISLNFITRRFMAVSARTLSHDLQKLVKQGFIKKLGNTRGALYSPTT